MRVRLLLVLAACGGSSADTNHPATPSNREPAPAPAPAPTPAPVATPVPSKMPPACQVYHDEVMALLKCDKMAAAADGMRQGLESMEQSFASFDSLPPDSRAQAWDAAASGCQAGADAIKQSMVAIGC